MSAGNELTPVYKVFEDRRNYPRLKMNIQAQATGPGGQVLDVLLYDLSPESAQIRFPISSGTNLFLNKNTPIEELKSLMLSISFELNYKNISTSIVLNAHPVYLRTVDEKMMASGILFIENGWEEMKKVSDYLFYQLESSFSDIEILKKFKREGEPVETRPSEPVKQNNNAQAKTDEDPAKVEPVDPPVRNKATTDIEYLKAEMARMAASLKTIQETTRHIDEQIALLEHKLNRRG